MKAIVGLGNPGAEYRGTRHNVGFAVVEELARRWRTKLKSTRKADLVVVPDRGAVLAQPKTFMNASGEAVGQLAAFYKIAPEDLLIVVDEVQLPLGRLRLRASGSAGGHNGLKSVIGHIGTEFPRLRVGVGRGDPRWDLADHVLSRFQADERPIAEETVSRAADAVEMFLEQGIDSAMNRFNTRGEPTVEQEKEDR